ncbi:MAG: bacterioferritin [Bryobacterales bacterium]|nr:bacterioferritin [Bryobacterales bacterium]
MKGNERVLADLNECLKAELTAINQYFLHSRMDHNWGYLRLAAYNRKESIEEMKHADELIERILYLEGTPNMTDLFPIRVGANVKAQLENDLRLEMDAIPRLNAAIRTAVEVGDNGSRQLFERILVDEEKHADWLEAQLHMIEEIGMEKYLSQQMHEED